MDLVEIIRVELQLHCEWIYRIGGKGTYQLLHGCLAGLVDPFHELKDMVRIAIDHCNSNVVVIFVLEFIFVNHILRTMQ